MKKSKYKPMFLGAFAGLVIASFVLIFMDSGDIDGWVWVTLFAGSAWLGLMVISLLASRKKQEDQQ